MLAQALARLFSVGDGPFDPGPLVDAHEGRALVTRPDQLIFSEQDPLTELYLLVSGTVRLFVGEGPTRRTTLLLTAPALFADRDLLAGCAVSQEAARSVERAHLLCHPAANLAEAWAQEALRPAWTKDLLRRAARASRFAAYLAQPLEDRLLWLLHEHAGANEGELPTHESLALMTDAAEKSVGRALRTLEETGRLTLVGRRGWRFPPETAALLFDSGLLPLLHRIEPS